MTVNLPNQHRIVVAPVIVRWVRSPEYGMETLLVEKQTRSRVAHVITRLAQQFVESIP